ncbi:MAG: site-specific integrase [Ilumatobacteraceae bacterium]
MAWKATGRPTVRQQRGRWVVRVDGVDTESGKARPRQLGTFSSQRAARNAAAAAIESGREQFERRTVAALVDRWVRSRTDIGPNQRQQYRWAAQHIAAGIGGIVVDQLTREDLTRWFESLAASGTLSRRSLQIVRMTLRAALADAVAEGDLRRSVATNVPLPREVARVSAPRLAEAWDEDELGAFLDTVRDHRWGGPMRLEALYGLRRSELLALRWVRVDLHAGLITIAEGLVEADGALVWSAGKNARSRRRIAIDPETTAALSAHLQRQSLERARARELWQDNDLVVATQLGGAVRPRNYSHTLERLIARAGVRRVTSHGLRHTAATHMVAGASDLGEVRAAAEILGHSPEMLMSTYAHALPASLRTVTAKIGARSARIAQSKAQQGAVDG